MGTAADVDAEVIQLQEFCGVDSHQAVTLLKKYATVESAANAFFTDPAGALKEELPPNEWGPADNMPEFHVNLDDMANAPSMSRPPSRVANKPSVDAAVGQQFSHHVYAQDDDLQRAIAMSKQSMPGQESGLTSSDQQFGPANRAHYDPNQWAITTVASSREVIEHGPPSKRRRVAGQPAFLRGSRETGYLAPLLNIYHSIPLARHALLLPSFRVLSYGTDSDWWAGTTDENNKSISVETVNDYDPNRHKFLAETQCLMAFLDKTERAYGSVDALADMYAHKSVVSETGLSRFIHAWIMASRQQLPDDQLSQIFSSEALRAPSLQNMDYDRKEFQCLEAPVEDALTMSLMDLMDKIIWCDSIDNVDDVWMERCAQVFTMRIHGLKREGRSLGLEIPALWYPDRYMSTYKEAAREMRIQVLQLQRQLQKCSLIQRRCISAQGPDKRMIKIRDVLEAASKLSTDILAGRSQQEETSASLPSDASSPTDRHVQQELQAILARIDLKVETLEIHKQKLRAEMRRLSQTLTPPAEDDSAFPRLKYVLQGVSTKPNVTYVRARLPQDAELVQLDQELPVTDEQTWWRFAWNDGVEGSSGVHGPPVHGMAHVSMDETTASYSIERVTEAQVLEAARVEHDSVLLVYADQRAIDHTVPPLSASLQQFMEQDNRAFRAEFDEQPGFPQPNPGQQAYASHETDLMGDDEQSDAALREMTPMSMSGLPRDGDGQRSLDAFRSDEGYSSSQSVDGKPPPYNALTQHQAAEHQPNKIGLLADQMLERFDQDPLVEPDGPVHIEHAHKPLR